MTFHSKFDLASVVRIKGTLMRMIAVNSNSELTLCSWYDAEGHPNEYAFNTVDLELAPAQSGRFPGRR